MSVGFDFTLEIPTRWIDTDAYGHVNNAQYYSFFDTVVSTWLAREGGFDAYRDSAIGLCVESHCKYLAAFSFPETVQARLGFAEIGRSSVRYEILLYGESREDPAAEGYFVHVFVDRVHRKPVPIPEPLRGRMEHWRDNQSSPHIAAPVEKGMVS